jgi:hypothetical protein
MDNGYSKSLKNKIKAPCRDKSERIQGVIGKKNETAEAHFKGLESKAMGRVKKAMGGVGKVRKGEY